MDRFEQFLHAIKAVSPDPSYTKRSREVILLSPRDREREAAPAHWFPIRAPLDLQAAFRLVAFSLKPAAALVFVSALIVLLLGGLPYLRTVPLRLAGLDRAVIQAEELTISVALDDLAYYEQSAQSVRTALKESSSVAPPQLSSAILNEEEALAAPAALPLDDTIDEALRALSQ